MPKMPQVYKFKSSYTLDDIARSRDTKNDPPDKQVRLTFERTNPDGKKIRPVEGVIQSIILKMPNVTCQLLTPRGETWEVFMVIEGFGIGSGNIKRPPRR